MTSPGAGPIWTQGARLAEFIKRTTIHCYTENESSGPCGFREEDLFMFFPIVSLWELSVAMETIQVIHLRSQIG